MKRLLFIPIAVALLFTFNPLPRPLANAQGVEDPTVYVTNTGKKYHRAGCGYLRQSSIALKLSEASKIYTPCSRCYPGSSSVSNSTGNGDKVVGTTPRGHTIYEGPRGGRYHISKSGKKVYERKKKR